MRNIFIKVKLTTLKTRRGYFNISERREQKQWNSSQIRPIDDLPEERVVFPCTLRYSFSTIRTFYRTYTRTQGKHLIRGEGCS